MPELSTFNWTIICVVLSTLSGLAVFFLKDVFKKNEKQSDDINGIQKEYAPRTELNSATNALRNENKSVSERLAENEKDIHYIREHYVTKTEFKELRAELREENRTIAKDVADIKAHFLTKDEFQQTIFTMSRSIEKTSEDSAKKYDKMYDILIELKGEITRAKN